MSVLLLDNDGLNTHTIAQYLGELGIEAEVYHEQLSLADITELDPSHIVLSPGTQTIDETIHLIKHIGPNRPILGIGLGFIAVIQALDGIITREPSLHAGQVLSVQHVGEGIFKGLPDAFASVCYQHHNVNVDNLPKTLDVTAWAQLPHGQRDLIIAVKHQTWPLQAILCDPTAILSEHGHALLRNFLQ